MSPSLSLHPVLDKDRERITAISVAPEQIKFSGTVAEAFASAEEGIDFHAIWQGDEPVGFFKIDRHYPSRYAFAREGEIGLRAFMIDRARQGQGLATRAVRALPAYLRKLYPQAPSVVLTVNFVNPAAKACYLKGGFIDTGETYPDGEAGPQNILRMDLSARDEPQTLRTRFRPFFGWIRRNIPRGLRVFVGGVLIVGGVFGFLPILGFWMIPLGVMVAAMDVQLYRRWKRRRSLKQLRQ